MAIIYVYSIGEFVSKRDDIDLVKSANIEKVITKILGNNELGLPGEIRRYKIDDAFLPDHGFQRIRSKDLTDAKRNQIADDFARDLFDAECIQNEKVKRRDLRITAGMLIVKIDEHKVVILKLEDNVIVDKETFILADSFSVDRKYYKAAISYNGGVNIVDKKQGPANYWTSKFLNLTPMRDDKTNTQDIMNYLANGTLFCKDAFADDKDSDKLNSSIKKYLKNSEKFELEDLVKRIQDNMQRDDIHLTTIFSSDFLKSVDADFVIDKKTVHKNLHAEIQLSRNTKIVSEDIEESILSDEMIFDEFAGTLKIRIAPDLIKEVKRQFNR